VTRIKICGISEPQHILVAAKAGANFIGLVFAPSKRRVSVEQAAELANMAHEQRTRPAVVGVFVNSSLEEVNRIAELCRLDWVQLSGNETWHYCQQIKRPIIKAVHISSTATVQTTVDEIAAGYQLLSGKEMVCLLDAQVGDSYGGTGEVFNWQLARDVSASFPVIVAGGLNAANVCQLVSEVHPWGVDVSTGVESNGRKDPEKIMAFIESVRRVEVNAGSHF